MVSVISVVKILVRRKGLRAVGFEEYVTTPRRDIGAMVLDAVFYSTPVAGTLELLESNPSGAVEVALVQHAPILKSLHV